MVLVPTSSETLWQLKTRSLLTDTVPLKLTVQLSIIQWAPSPHSRITSWQTYSTFAGVQIKSAGTFSVSKVRLLLPTRCTDMVQILNPMTLLFWPMEWAESVCLGLTRDKASCQSLWAKFLSGNQTRSVHSETRHKFLITGSLFNHSEGYNRLTCILMETGGNPSSIFFIIFFTFTRGICWSFLSQLPNLQMTNRLKKCFCRWECSSHLLQKYRLSLSLWTLEDRCQIKDDRFVSLWYFQILQADKKRRGGAWGFGHI